MADQTQTPVNDTILAGVSDTPATPPAQAAADATKVQTETKTDAQTTTTEKPAEKPVVPEKYDLKLSEGSLLKPDRLEKIALEAKERGLSQEDAQALVEREDSVLKDYATAQQEQLQRVQTEWLSKAETDKEFGGEQFGANAETAKRFIDRYGSPELKQALNATGLGNHPELIRMCYRAGKAMANDKAVIPGTHDSSSGQRPEQVLFPNTPTN